MADIHALVVVGASLDERDHAHGVVSVGNLIVAFSVDRKRVGLNALERAGALALGVELDGWGREVPVEVTARTQVVELLRLLGVLLQQVQL